MSSADGSWYSARRKDFSSVFNLFLLQGCLPLSGKWWFDSPSFQGCSPTSSKAVGFRLRPASQWLLHHGLSSSHGMQLAAHLPEPCGDRMSWEKVRLHQWRFLQTCHLQQKQLCNGPCLLDASLDPTEIPQKLPEQS